jgi:peptide/nickel transport system substrate-binding protein
MSRFTGRLPELMVWASLRLFTILFALVQGLSCSKAPAGPANTSASLVTLTIGVPNITGEDPLRGIQHLARLISFEGLVGIGRDGRAVPRLAERWSGSTDGLTWTFQLRPKSFFHDGTPVDGDAVKTSLERSLAGADRDMQPGLTDILSIDSPSPQEVTIRLRNQSTFLLDDLGVAISKIGANGRAVGAGAYMAAPAAEGQIELLASRHHYGGVPDIGRVVIRPYPTVRTAWAAMMRGEIDFLYEVGEDAREFIEGEASTTVFPFLRSYVYGVIFNARRDIFHDPRIRRALTNAVDRQAIVRQAFKGHARPINVSAWPEHWAFDHEASSSPHDPARALAILDSAGVRQQRDAPGRPAAKLHFTCLVPENLPLWERMALLVQRDLAQIGVDMRLESAPIKQFGARLASGDFDAVFLEHIVGNNASRPFSFWHSTSRQNTWGFRSPAVDQALDDLRHAGNDAEYRNSFKEYQLQMLNDPPAILLALPETARAVSNRFEVVAPPSSDILPTISNWHLASDRLRVGN